MNKNTIITGVAGLAVGILLTYFTLTANNPKNNIQENTHVMSDGSVMMNHDNSMSMDSMMMDMLAGMRGKSGKDLEKAFITEMIPHHQGAVDMAKMLLKDPSINSNLKAFAENIIKAQESEILQMNTWLKNY
jgi:uncharacterized protein (DUF305 family)